VSNPVTLRGLPNPVGDTPFRRSTGRYPVRAMPDLARALTALTALALLGAGCSYFGPGKPPPGFEPSSSSYACSDFVLEVRFWHPEEITIAGRGEVATLERREGRAGDRYRGEGFTFWTEGEDRAFLQLPAGQIRDCFRIREEPAAG